MEILRCKSPEMVRKEISVHLLACNLVRALMARTAKATGQVPGGISFRAAQQTVMEFHIVLLLGNDLAKFMVNILAEHQAGHRPGRSEPRAVKRRPEPFPKLQYARPKARKLCCYKR